MTLAQSIFDTTESKGVLIITPRGDAVGYRDVDVARELDAVLARIGELTAPLVVADFGGTQYFGSVMIGAISYFAEQTRSRGGTFAVCRVSPDMRQVLRVMQLDTHWPLFESRSAAISAVKRTT